MMGSLRSRLVVAVFTLMIVVSSTSAADSFGFLVEPRDTSAVQGETVTLYCTVNQPADTLMWVRDTVVISQTLQIVGVDDDDASRYSIGYDGLTYNLVIRSVMPSDVGSYKCVAFGSGLGLLSQAANLEVSSPPIQEYPTLTSTVTGLIAVGETIEVVCEIEGGNPVPEIELIMGDESLVTASGELVYVWVTSQADDGVVFECRAVHPLWSEARSSFIGPFRLVTEPPQIVLAPNSVEVEVRETANFVCSASSAPRAVYSWFINDVQVETTDDGSVIIDSTATTSILHVQGSKDAVGVVRCAVTAPNGEAFAESTLTLIVTEISTQPPVTPTQPRATPTKPAATTTQPGATPTKPAATTTVQPSVTDSSRTATPTSMTRVGRETPAHTTPAPAPTSTATATPPLDGTTPTKATDRQPTENADGTAPATSQSATDVTQPKVSDSETTNPIEGSEPPIRGASSFDTIFVASVSAIVSLIGIIFIAAIGAFCVVTVRRRRKRREDISGSASDGDVFFRSRYISIVRSWFKPVHSDTQKTLTSFDGPTPDQSPYNTITSRR